MPYPRRLAAQDLRFIHEVIHAPPSLFSVKASLTRGMCVYSSILFLSNKDGKCCPLGWKSKTIQQVFKSVKCAETRSLDLGMEDSIYLASMFTELYTGKSKSDKNIHVDMNIDSKTLHDSLFSTKQVEAKTIRHLIAWMKQQMEEGNVSNIDWICSQEMLADVFTKKNVNTHDIIETVTKGHMKIFRK